ncbi:MAG: LacI family transcriptional regulator [Chloroflexi bacterium]|nr:LacI family transcriptional regulator [Chloroflexota bacterium]
MASVTIRDVAQKAGVGVGTVSRVLNSSTAVSEPTRQKVQQAIQELKYTPSPIARRLSLGRTMTIGVIAPFFIRPSYVERLRGIDAALADSEYDFIIYNVETVARRDICFRELPRQEKVDGLLIITLPPTDKEVDDLIQLGIPTVLVDGIHHRISHVMVDDIAGGHQATQHLIDLGHRKIGYISDFLQESPFGFRPVADRFQGYRKALEAANISFQPDYHRQGELSRREARRLAHELLTLPDPPTAIFAYSDTQAFGVLRAAQALGLKVPEQLSVIGYDDLEISELLHLTTIRQHLYQSGVQGAEILLNEITAPSLQPKEIVLPTELVVRETTAPPV